MYFLYFSALVWWQTVKTFAFSQHNQHLNTLDRLLQIRHKLYASPEQLREKDGNWGQLFRKYSQLACLLLLCYYSYHKGNLNLHQNSIRGVLKQAVGPQSTEHPGLVPVPRDTLQPLVTLRSLSLALKLAPGPSYNALRPRTDSCSLNRASLFPAPTPPPQAFQGLL